MRVTSHQSTHKHVICTGDRKLFIRDLLHTLILCRIARGEHPAPSNPHTIPSAALALLGPKVSRVLTVIPAIHGAAVIVTPAPAAAP